MTDQEPFPPPGSTFIIPGIYQTASIYRRGCLTCGDIILPRERHYVRQTADGRVLCQCAVCFEKGRRTQRTLSEF